MKEKSSTFLISILIGTFFLFPVSVSAKLSATISVDPQNPTPYSPVSLTLVSYDFDVNQSTITWSSGNKVLLKGVGQKKLSLQTGAVGQVLPISVTADTSTGGSITLSVPVVPESVDILYESEESYVPLFYEGLTLPGEGSTVKFTAMPSMSEGGPIISPSSLSYSWYVNDDFIDSASGIGRQSALIELSVLSPSTDIKVLVHSPKGIVAEKTITVSPHAVIPALYTYDEVLGTHLNSFISNRYESTHDFAIVLEPYFLSAKGSLTGSPIFNWLLDGETVTPLGGKILALHPKENSYGLKNLSVSVSNQMRTLQSGQINAEIIFDTRK